MKKLILYILTICVLLSMTACSKKNTAGPEGYDEEALKADAQKVSDELLAGDYEAVTARFDEKMTAAVSLDALKTGWESVASQLGEHIERVSVEGMDSSGYYAVEVTERFLEGGLTIRAVYSADSRISGLRIVPATLSESAAPTESDVYTEEAVTVAGDPEMPLDGILTLPKDTENPPVVILVHGSGASDKDETIYANKPFADLAHGLAERGIATLRYDKRHYSYPENAAVLGADLTLRDETLDDVDAAIELMRGDGRVDSEKIFVLGHSLGGMLSPAIAAEHPELAGVISMAGTLRTLWEVVYDQNQEAIAAMDVSTLSAEDKATLDAQIAQIEADIITLRGDFSGLSNDTVLMGIPVGYWKSLGQYCGMNFIEQVSMPMLILQGDADFQIYPDKDYVLWQKTLADRSNVTFHLYEGLNHLMMPTAGARDISEYQTASTVAAQVIDDIAAFVGSIK